MFHEQKCISLRTSAHEENILKEDEEAFKDLDKDDVIKLSIAHILRIYKYVKMVKEYEGALEDLHKVDIPKPNNAFTLNNFGDVKMMLKDY
jgi:hypothetical protein